MGNGSKRGSLRSRRTKAAAAPAIALVACAGLLLSGPATAQGVGPRAGSPQPAGIPQTGISTQPAASSQTLYDVSVIGPTNAWAVGIDSGHPALAEHWNGHSWTVSHTLPAGHRKPFFAAVAAVGAGDVWGVGDFLSGGRHSYAFSEHWNGSAWTLEPFAVEPHTYSIHVVDVAALGHDDVWAVGSIGYGSIGEGGALIEHWDGTSWSIADVLPASDELESIDFASPDDGWAIGTALNQSDSGAPGPTSHLVSYHWDGSTWTPILMEATQPGGEPFVGRVSVLGPDDAWMVGTIGHAHGVTPMAEHWDGVRWVFHPTDRFTSDISLQSIVVVSRANAWAVGSSGASTGTAVIEHWNGSTWTHTTAPVVPNADLVGVDAVGADDVRAVGGTNGSVLREHDDGHGWIRG